MSSDPEIFVDGLLNVTLIKGLVRLDLYSLSATEAQKDGQPSPQFRQRLVMHPQALLEIVQSMQVAINALTEKGLLNLKLPSNGPQVAPPPSAAGSMPEPPAPLAGVQDGVPPAAAPTESAPAPAPRPRSRNFPSTMTS